MAATSTSSNGWALILGSSSGFGAATALELARSGLDIYGVHLDRKATMPLADKVVADLRALGREVSFFNLNATDATKRHEVLDHIELKLRERQTPGAVKVLFHSLAFGTLKPFCPLEDGDGITQAQMEMTLDVMANSLVYWTQELVRRKLMVGGGRIYAMTSEGSTTVWPSYGPVSAAKAALEAHCRQLAYELAPVGITVNAIRAGVTDTPALRKIPGCEALLEAAARRNPSKRITTPEDVARCVAALARPETAWLTGNVLGIDGGEHIAG
ncbi:MAG: SDR family oxidoreductase [Deltaproteobacteria bacterium]|nr:SDR family oxidoreductase [Deltaproteobacteria bacterium]